MYPYAVGIFAVAVLFTDASLAGSAQYTVVPQHTLQGWSYDLQNINRVQCLLACSRKIYCFSVNYNSQDQLCQINKRFREESSGNFKQDNLFEYIEKVLDEDFKAYGVDFSLSDVTYEEARDMCRNQLGALASYDDLYNAFQPRLDNCTEGWLISGEIAFTEVSDKCALRPPDQRSNVFPCKTYLSGYYCYRDCNQSLDALGYIPVTQRIIRLTGNNLNKLTLNEAGVCCSGDLGGRLATPYEAYDASYTVGVDLCTVGWLAGEMAGYPCTGNIPTEFWLFPTGNLVMLMHPTNEYFAMCYISLPNETLTFPDPFPPHGVMIVSYALTYDEGQTKCLDYGGTLATLAQVSFAHSLGYDCCISGWIQSELVVHPITHPRNGSGSNHVANTGYQNPDAGFGAYCFFSLGVDRK